MGPTANYMFVVLHAPNLKKRIERKLFISRYAPSNSLLNKNLKKRIEREINDSYRVEVRYR